MTVTSYYMARVVRVPPLVACAAYDDFAIESSTWSVDTGNGVLVVGKQEARHDGSRVAPAYVGSRGSRMAVALEIEPWSSTRVEIGLRPLRWGPRQWPSERQLSVGHAALRIIADEITAWADEPLRSLTTSWTSHPVTSVTAYVRAITRFRDEDLRRRDRQ